MVNICFLKAKEMHLKKNDVEWLKVDGYNEGLVVFIQLMNMPMEK